MQRDYSIETWTCGRDVSTVLSTKTACIGIRVLWIWQLTGARRTRRSPRDGLLATVRDGEAPVTGEAIRAIMGRVAEPSV